MSLGVATGQRELEEEDARPPGPCLAVVPPDPQLQPLLARCTRRPRVWLVPLPARAHGRGGR